MYTFYKSGTLLSASESRVAARIFYSPTTLQGRQVGERQDVTGPTSLSEFDGCGCNSNSSLTQLSTITKGCGCLATYGLFFDGSVRIKTATGVLQNKHLYELGEKLLVLLLQGLACCQSCVVSET